MSSEREDPTQANVATSSSAGPQSNQNTEPLSNLSHIYPALYSSSKIPDASDNSNPSSSLSYDGAEITPSPPTESNPDMMGGNTSHVNVTENIPGESTQPAESETNGDVSDMEDTAAQGEAQEGEPGVSEDTEHDHTEGSREGSIDTGRAILAALAVTGQSSQSISRQSGMFRHRAGTEVVRARWQPDAEVTYCPICRTQFGWVVRKHHCRKCGRVVCGACSTHRITIPYEYISRPPGYLEDEAFLATYHTGGERVRLCNPCVPDPNVAPPQVTSPGIPGRDTARGSTSAASTSSNSGRRGNRSSLVFDNFSQRPRVPSIVGGSPAAQGNPDGNRSRSSTVPAHDFTYGYFDERQSTSSRRMEPRGVQQQHRFITDDNSRPLPRLPPPTEDDICPVCHRLLPPRSLPDFEDLRITHISACIEAHTSSHFTSHNRSGPYPSHLQPSGSPQGSDSSRESRQSRGRGPSITGPSSSRTPQIIPNTPEARMQAREQAHAAVVLGASRTPPLEAGRQTRLFPYKATEKDCVDDAECTICLEEFEVGADMARLECFCRFHLHCIRGWWVNHHGRCPVHQHDGYGF